MATTKAFITILMVLVLVVVGIWGACEYTCNNDDNDEFYENCSLKMTTEDAPCRNCEDYCRFYGNEEISDVNN